jgi:hypothetical protein
VTQLWLLWFEFYLRKHKEPLHITHQHFALILTPNMHFSGGRHLQEEHAMKEDDHAARFKILRGILANKAYYF